MLGKELALRAFQRDFAEGRRMIDEFFGPFDAAIAVVESQEPISDFAAHALEKETATAAFRRNGTATSFVAITNGFLRTVDRTLVGF